MSLIYSCFKRNYDKGDEKKNGKILEIIKNNIKRAVIFCQVDIYACIDVNI